MKIKGILFTFFTLGWMLGFAQSNIRVNNFWGDTYFINPASIHQNTGDFSIGGRKQWVSFPGAPISFFGTATTYLTKLNTQFGLNLVSDKIGYTSTTSVELSYAYLLKLNRYWDLGFGVALCGQNLTYDFSESVFPTINDPIQNSTLFDKNKVNTHLGMELTDGYWLFGISSQNFISIFDVQNNIHVNSNFLYAMYRERSRNYLDYSFGLCGIQSKNIVQLECSANLFLKTSSPSNAYISDEAFCLGVYYRTWSEIGVMFGIDISEQVHLSYTYDYNVSSISQSSFGTHEIILRYRLPSLSPCYRRY